MDTKKIPSWNLLQKSKTKYKESINSSDSNLLKDNVKKEYFSLARKCLQEAGVLANNKR